MKTTILVEKLHIKPCFSTKKPVSVENSFSKQCFSTPKPVPMEKSFSMLHFSTQCLFLWIKASRCVGINEIAARKITSADGNQFVQYLCLTKSFIH